jgi:hypothetical protein
VHATERPERESTLLPGAAPQDRVPEFDTALAQHGAAEQDRPSALAQPEQDKDKKEGGSVVGTFISGGVSLGIGVVGILSSDSFSIWSFALIAMGALVIFNGLRKMAKNSDK